MAAHTGEQRQRVHELYALTPQAAGLTLTIAQCYEIEAMGIPWPISGDLSRTSPVRRQTLSLRAPSHEQDPEEEPSPPR